MSTMTVQERQQQQQQQPPPPVVKRRTLEKTTINHIPLVHVLTSRIDNDIDTHPQVRIIPFDDPWVRGNRDRGNRAL